MTHLAYFFKQVTTSVITHITIVINQVLDNGIFPTNIKAIKSCFYNFKKATAY